MNNWKTKGDAQGHHNYAQVRATKDNGLKFAQEGNIGAQSKNAKADKQEIGMIQSKRGMHKGILKTISHGSHVKEEGVVQKLFIHGGVPHGLETCPDISDDQLFKLLIQLG